VEKRQPSLNCVHPQSHGSRCGCRSFAVRAPWNRALGCYRKRDTAIAAALPGFDPDRDKAKIILPINLTNKLGHTTHWKVSNYVNSVEKYIGKLVDYILVNNEEPSLEQIERYRLESGDGVIVMDDFKDSRVERVALLSRTIPLPVAGDFSPNTRGFIRHDSEKLANCILNIINKNL